MSREASQLIPYMTEEAEVNTMLNSLWNVLIHHTELQDAHVTARESLGMVCLFTKPEKIVLQTGKVCGEVTVSFQQLLPIVNSCQHIA